MHRRLGEKLGRSMRKRYTDDRTANTHAANVCQAGDHHLIGRIGGFSGDATEHRAEKETGAMNVPAEEPYKIREKSKTLSFEEGMAREDRTLEIILASGTKLQLWASQKSLLQWLANKSLLATKRPTQ